MAVAPSLHDPGLFSFDVDDPLEAMMADVRPKNGGGKVSMMAVGI